MAHWKFDKREDKTVIKLIPSSHSDKAMLEEKVACGTLKYEDCYGYYIELCNCGDEPPIT